MNRKYKIVYWRYTKATANTHSVMVEQILKELPMVSFEQIEGINPENLKADLLIIEAMDLKLKIHLSGWKNNKTRYCATTASPYRL